VTVLADRAAMADAAATIIANAVDLPGDPQVARIPAQDLAPDSDLGCHLVTQAVGTLTSSEVGRALDAGEIIASELLSQGLIRAAALHLQRETRMVGGPLQLKQPATSNEGLVHA
jgi:hypothetical protein